MNKKERSIYRAAKRKTTGGFLHRVEEVSAVDLGAIAIKAAIESISISTQLLDHVYMGNVLSAGLEQSPARWASKLAEIDIHT
ncbi:thiolase family protein [Paenimyroides ummariense]|uniref:thiolase family protein n=1 Tax=Paenimyroides ummariense TaxID=913024 RepID=UPI000B8679C4|nr:hypothetical protein [Paenimyroides ummariense]